VSSELSRDQLRQLTKLGARVRLAEITRERIALNAILNGSGNDVEPKQTTSAESVRRRHRRATWTAAQRRAVSERMKKYWAKRRHATGKKGRAKRVTPA
jgi:hypothetical protein